jgi:IS605 OrfB family transposase
MLINDEEVSLTQVRMLESLVATFSCLENRIGHVVFG